MHAGRAGVPERWNPYIAFWAGLTVVEGLFGGVIGMASQLTTAVVLLPMFIERSPA